MGNDTIDRAIVETIINLATALDLGVIAKGIESRETIEKLLAMTCVRGQGSFISVPLAAENSGRIFGPAWSVGGATARRGIWLENVLAM
jgi:EAL domain-containing protein (putative c-di-GMP-specific phosphodiesterase class I)